MDALPSSLLWLPQSTVDKLLAHYDYPHPQKAEIITGYDQDHALRTAKMSAAVAHYLGHDCARVQQYQVACLLHDLGRAGLDQVLFSAIWTWARKNNIPTRPQAWRQRYPTTPYGEETEAFWDKYQPQLQALSIQTDSWAKEQVEMRLGFARRLRRLLLQVVPQLQQYNIVWFDWMETVALYYYYPEKLAGVADWVQELAEILVACEQFEAYSNQQRGQDYYDRDETSFVEACRYLNQLKARGQVSAKVLSAVYELIAQGFFDALLVAARACPLSADEQHFLRSLNTGGCACQL